MCNNNLQELVTIWQAMPRNNAQELAAADNFFDNELMPVSRDIFLTKEACRTGMYDGMILTLGTSWQPLALSISALKPKQVLLLGTAGTEHLAKQVKNFVNSDTVQFDVMIVDRGSADGVYVACRYWLEKNPCLDKLCADITGGTKAMVAALAMYAGLKQWDIYYVESKYLPLYRRPEPGSERLIKLDLPK